MILADESLIENGVSFADRHGVTAFILVAVLLSLGLFIWRVWVFFSPLIQKWIETNIDTTNRNADSLELIGAAVTAAEKSNELVLAKIDGVNGNVEQIQAELKTLREKIEVIENRHKE